MRLTALLLLPCAALVAASSSLTILVQSVPSSPSSSSKVLPSPAPLAQIAYDASSSTATLTSYTPPRGSYAPSHLLRVGLHDPDTKAWRGVVTSAASFDEGLRQRIALYVDEEGRVYHVGFGAEAKGSKQEGVEVEVVKREAGPKPVLNRPVVLNEEGKLEGKEVEKTFLQKYWWAIGLFLLVQLVAGGGEK